MEDNSGIDPKQYELTPPAHLFRLSGGIKLIVDAGAKCQVIGIKPGREAHFSLNGRKIGATLFDYSNIRVLARTKCYDDDELLDPISDNLALRAFGPDGKCVAFSQEFYWSGVSHVFHEQGKYLEEGYVRRLTTQIRTCLRRFEKLFIAYSMFLETLAESPPQKGHLVRDKHTVNIGGEFGALLDGLYALRDAVNAVAFRVLFGDEALLHTKKFKIKVLANTQSAFAQLVNASMFDEQNGDLLLSRMSTYRSVALHCMGTSNPVTADSVLFREETGLFGPILRAVYPLYDDMAKLREIERGTAVGFSFRSNLDELKRFVELRTHDDALDFGFDCFVRLLTMARLLGDELGLESRHFEITDRDIIGTTTRGQ
ncbi:hypothetical protein NKI50_30140 [Mesorhizobium sp. M0563]|uniref:hypothetical protein n=1 Tax=Mesorhizobium sp. M0563 TaxID=2956959 RepID=UPI00333C1BD4